MVSASPALARTPAAASAGQPATCPPTPLSNRAASSPEAPRAAAEGQRVRVLAPRHGTGVDRATDVRRKRRADLHPTAGQTRRRACHAVDKACGVGVFLSPGLPVPPRRGPRPGNAGQIGGRRADFRAVESGQACLDSLLALRGANEATGAATPSSGCGSYMQGCSHAKKCEATP